MANTYVVQEFLRPDCTFWELPLWVAAPPHNQVQRPVQLAIQPRHIPLLIRLRLPGERPLYPQSILKTQPLTILTDSALGLEVQLLPYGVWVRQLLALVDEQLVIPLVGTTPVDAANLARHCAAPLQPFDPEVDTRRLALAEEELLGEWCGQALVEALLVQVKSGLEGGLLAHEERRP